MKVLWITNVMFPRLAQELGQAKTTIGGWTYSAAEELKRQPEVELGVATVYQGVEVQCHRIDGISYYLIPYRKTKMDYDPTYEENCRKVQEMFCPDVVHIYGSEYPISLAYVRACGNDNVVLSLQGIPSKYTRYFYSGMTLSNILRSFPLMLQKGRFDSNNKNEVELLSKVHYFEGRSEWDYSMAWSYNVNLKYYFCSRTLRKSFYEHHWDIAQIQRHTIFLSQAQYPIKGFHEVIKALPYILRIYDDVKVIVAGDSPLRKKSLHDYIKYLGYGRYLKNLIIKYGVVDHIEFVGNQSEEQICERYKRAHVFVCPSSIENVPNSLAEAQMLGVPSIASFVGGNNSLIEHGKTGFLYRFEEPELLAKYICDIFGNDNLALRLSSAGRECALKRHDKTNNISTLIEMYKDIIDRKNENT